MPTASPTGQRRGTATLRGATPSPASHWPPATPHRERGAPLGAAPLREPHPSLATYRPIGSPLGRRTFAHWPPLGHTLRDGAATWPKGSRPLPLPGLRGPHTRPYWPPTGQKRPPSLAPTGQLTAQRPPTGHLRPPPPSLATFGHTLREGATPSLVTHWPKGDGHRRAAFAPALTGHPGGPHWPQRDGRGTPSPGPPPTGHLRPTWPSEAFGHLHPHAPHRAIGTPSDGRPPHPYRLATYWLRPALPHSPDFRGAGA